MHLRSSYHFQVPETQKNPDNSYRTFPVYEITPFLLFVFLFNSMRK